ncbi:major histocompatibility complex class I-related gene protein-like [Brachyistius frenatus]|uniref:major histocompatibility complex class I-related gene protein-like n=1 Tax=Brachyistius frenatus TaxID=100188 RepID=UPI0037E9513E
MAVCMLSLLAKQTRFKLLIVVFASVYHVVSPVKHSLKFSCTGSSGVADLPEFVGVLTADGTEMVKCNSSLKTAEPEPTLIKEFLEENPEHMQSYTRQCRDSLTFFRKLYDLTAGQSQTEGVHIFQRIYGCEWDDETEEADAFDKFGYNGEDFVAFNQTAETWSFSTPQGEAAAREWNRDKSRTHFSRHYLSQVCVDWLQKYLDYGRSLLQRRELPALFLLQKTSLSPVTCHATGFYPGSRAVMFWRKDGKQLREEDVEPRQILPNGNGTFQMRVVLKPSSDTSEDWTRYDCVFRLSGVNDDVVTRLDKSQIKTNADHLVCTRLDVTNHCFIALVICHSAVALIFLAFTMRKTHKDPNDTNSQRRHNRLILIGVWVVVPVLLAFNISLYLTFLNNRNSEFDISIPTDMQKWMELSQGTPWRPSYKI